MKISLSGNGQTKKTVGSLQFSTLHSPFSILFVCTGNTCRSPMAEVLARHAAEGLKLEFGSAGVAALHGEPASQNARHAMEGRGLSLEGHRARRLTPELAAQADLILTMTASHAQAVRQAAPAAKVFTLREYLGEAGDVADPWGGSRTEYEACAGELESLVLRAIERLTTCEKEVF